MPSLALLNGLTARMTGMVLALVALAVLLVTSLGYLQLSHVIKDNYSGRIDQAARAAAAILQHGLDGEFEVLRDDDNRPQVIRIRQVSPEQALSFRPVHDEILHEIGLTNQGAANLFKLNEKTQAFEPFATTMRGSDGSIPVSWIIDEGHPAWSSAMDKKVFVGEVPMMGRERLTYFTPIQCAQGNIAGLLGVDVGSVEDISLAGDQLRTVFFAASIAMLAIIGALGTTRTANELKPLRALSAYANALAAGKSAGAVPFTKRNDEIGTLAQGLTRVVDLQNDLVDLAYGDELTGLGNRARYLADLSMAMVQSVEEGQAWALIHLDLDKFMDVNDAYGQTAGDTILKKVGEAIREIVGDEVAVARLASDYYTILMRHDGDQAALSDICRRLVDRVAVPFALAEGEIQVGASLGVALLPDNAQDADEAHRNADLALRKAKDDGGGRFVFYAEEMNNAVQTQIRMQWMLREAIDKRQITVHFQPQIDPHDNMLAGIEALARWSHPDEGMISPGVFIPVAEASGLIVELGTLVLEETCHQARKWLDEGFDFKHLSVNVSPLQLWQPDFVDTVSKTLSRYDLDGRHICLEVTENVFVDNAEGKITAILGALRELGVSLSLDDFGSGYSSLGYLNRLPFDQLKVDRSFVTRVNLDTRKKNLLHGIVALGQGLGLKIVVEGAETEDEVSMIKVIGCDSVQGYYYTRPMAASDVPVAVSKITAAGQYGGDPRRA